ncbi:ABC transporter permease [Flavicella sp.]|nr:ABC transporter permease [Flavicella sp.]MDA9111676.1 ABC transporter permease [Flavicella sp.]
MNKTGFIRYFGWPEFKSIAGKNGKSLVVLIAIIFISLIAIGLGESAKQYLKIKMNDPFIKFVKVTNPDFSNHSIEDFDKVKLKKQFSYGDVSNVIVKYIYFRGADGKEKNATARLIDQDSEFFKFLFSPESDVFLTDTNFEDNEFGCVVTKKYLEKLGYNTLDVDYINYVDLKPKNRGDLLPIPISGVVKQLPDFADVLISKKFYNYAVGTECLDIEDDNHKTYLQFYLPDTKDIPEALLEIGYTRVSKDILLFNNGIIINKIGIQNYQEEREKVFDDFPSAIQFYDYHQIACGTKLNSDSPEYFSFSFNSLDSISPFKSYLQEKKLKIDMSTIEAKKNFNFFNKLSNLLSVSLILFSVFSIYIFTTNLVNNHIDKTKRNLGTLKAFGLGNDSVIFIYTLITSLLVISAFTIAYLLSFLIGNSVLEVLIDLSNIVVEDIKYTNINIIYLIVAFVVVPIFSISLRIWTKLKNATPGDLIYERQ